MEAVLSRLAKIAPVASSHQHHRRISAPVPTDAKAAPVEVKAPTAQEIALEERMKAAQNAPMATPPCLTSPPPRPELHSTPPTFVYPIVHHADPKRIAKISQVHL